MYAYHNKDKVRLKILYFSLEMSIQEKMSQFTCFWLYWYTKGRIRIDTKQLNSLNEESPLSLEVLELMESEDYNDFFDFVEDTVEFDETNRSPDKIYKECINFALAHGDVKYKDKVEVDVVSGKKVIRKVVDYYKSHDPELYIIKYVDHVGLYTPDSGMDLRQSIGKASSKDNVILRNLYKFTCVDIQQQAANKEDNEAFKLDRITPSPDGLGENKTTQRD